MPTTPPTSVLSELAHVLDAACADSAAGVVVLLAEGPDRIEEVELALRPLAVDQHPCDELHDLVAPERCWGVALVVPGRAHLLDAPDGPPQPIVSTYLRHRDGRAVSLLRSGATVTEQRGPVVGRLPELCRRILEPGPGERGGAP